MFEAYDCLRSTYGITGIPAGGGIIIGGGGGNTGNPNGSGNPVPVRGDNGAVRAEGDLAGSKPVELRLYDGRA